MTGAEWALIGSAVLPFLGNLFGMNKPKFENMTSTSKQTQTLPAQGGSPSKFFFWPFLENMGLQNLQRMQDWGYPSGRGLGMDSWIADIMGIMQPAWKDIMSKYSGEPEKKQRVYRPQRPA